MSFDRILSRIANGESVPSSEILPYLCLERRERRADVNRLLAEAYWRSGRESNLESARVSVRRAWLLGGFSPDLLPLYTQIHSALEDIPAIRDAYKRLGMTAAARGDVAGAVNYFNLWQYAYHASQRLDRYEYDFDILECVDRLARPHRLHPRPRNASGGGGKVCVAYLVRGVLEGGSVLIKTLLLHARYHDRSRVEPVFFVPESEHEVFAFKVGREYYRLFEEHGFKLNTAPDVSVTEGRLQAVARMIRDAGADVLVAGAALASFEHCFITALRPAPLTVGLVLGPPQQFAPFTLDWGVAWSTHPLIDCPVSCSLMEMGLELPDRDKIVPRARRELGIPDYALVLGTAGRHVKFQEPAFWRAVTELLDEHPRLHYLAMGVEESQIPFLSALLPAEVRPRISFLSWRGEDYLRSLCVADIYLDTFPSGGGTVVEDAAALGIPVVTFENNFMRLYDQTDWSPAAELFDMPEIAVPRGDYAQMKGLVSRMVEDPEYRTDVGRRCQQDIRRTRGNPERAIRKFEEIIYRVLDQESPRAGAQDRREAEVAETARRLAPRRNVPQLVVRAARQFRRVLRFGERMIDRAAGT
jgi:glycosyltransferase involved in cell wall biosynthesis